MPPGPRKEEVTGVGRSSDEEELEELEDESDADLVLNGIDTGFVEVLLARDVGDGVRGAAMIRCKS